MAEALVKDTAPDVDIDPLPPVVTIEVGVTGIKATSLSVANAVFVENTFDISLALPILFCHPFFCYVAFSNPFKIFFVISI
jgi:hypothetical protein